MKRDIEARGYVQVSLFGFITAAHRRNPPTGKVGAALTGQETNMTTTFSTPTEVITACTLTGTRKEQIVQKRAAITAWLATSEGSDYLATLQAGTAGQDSYNNMVLEQAGLRDVHENKGRLIKSKAGNWGREIGNRAYLLRRRECIAEGVTPGAGNRD